MAKNKEPLTYRQNVSRQEAYRIIKAVGCPLAIFALALFTISSFANFGTKLICPASGAMWIMGVIVAIYAQCYTRSLNDNNHHLFFSITWIKNGIRRCFWC